VNLARISDATCTGVQGRTPGFTQTNRAIKRFCHHLSQTACIIAVLKLVTKSLDRSQAKKRILAGFMQNLSFMTPNSPKLL